MLPRARRAIPPLRQRPRCCHWGPRVHRLCCLLAQAMFEVVVGLSFWLRRVGLVVRAVRNFSCQRSISPPPFSTKPSPSSTVWCHSWLLLLLLSLLLTRALRRHVCVSTSVFGFFDLSIRETKMWRDAFTVVLKPSTREERTDNVFECGVGPVYRDEILVCGHTAFRMGTS